MELARSLAELGTEGVTSALRVLLVSRYAHRRSEATEGTVRSAKLIFISSVF
jgi:hypothetical protein